jgi:hypothetical protein
MEFDARSRTRERRVLLVVLVAVVGGLVIVLRLASNDGDASRFAQAATGWVDPALTPSNLHVRTDGQSYDGEFFFRLGLDPLSDERTAHGITLDNPAYRQQRVGYPAAAWVLSGGQVRWLPDALIGVNLLALVVLAAAAVGLAGDMGRRAYWGLAIALVPGTAVALTRDTAEVMAAALLVAGLLAIRRDRPALAAVALAAAAVTRETTLVVPAAIVVDALLVWRQERRVPWRRTVPALVALSLCGLWQVFLWQRWHRLPVLAGSAAGAPIGGFVRAAVDTIRGGTLQNAFDLLGMIVSVALLVGVVLSVRRSSALRHEKIAAIGACWVAISLNRTSWFGHLGYERALVELGVLGAIVLLGGSAKNGAVPRPAQYVLFATMALWCLTGVVDAALI